MLTYALKTARGRGRRAQILGLILVLVAAAMLRNAGGSVGAGETVSITPAGPYTDGQHVTVNYSGFPAQQDLHVRICVPPATDGNDCEFLTDDNLGSSPQGPSGSIQYMIQKLPVAGGQQSFKCDDTVSPKCQLIVSIDLIDFTQPTARTDLTYAAGTGVPATTTTSTTIPSVTTTTVAGGGGVTTTTTAAGATTTTVAGATTTTSIGATTTTSASATTTSTAAVAAAGDSRALDDLLSRTGPARLSELFLMVGLLALAMGTVIRRRAQRLAGLEGSARLPAEDLD
jgi:hypothetical protein